MTSAPATEHRELAVLDSLVTSIVEARAAIAALQALELALLASAEALADEQTTRLDSNRSRDREIPRRAIAAEIGTATRANDRAVQRRMQEASVLTRDFAQAVRALGSGRIGRSHLAVILDTGGAITDASARADFERAAVALAERETPGRLRPLLRSLAARLDPASIDARHADAKDRRGVWVHDLDDGMAQLVATLPCAIAHAIRDRLTRFAHSVIDAREPVDRTEPAATPDSEHREGREHGDGRTVEQLRADVLADLLLAAEPTAAPRSAEPIVATVQVVVPALTLVGAGGDPAELAGHAPIDAGTARRLAGTAAGWDRLLTHPRHGQHPRRRSLPPQRAPAAPAASAR